MTSNIIRMNPMTPLIYEARETLLYVFACPLPLDFVYKFQDSYVWSYVSHFCLCANFILFQYLFFYLIPHTTAVVNIISKLWNLYTISSFWITFLKGNGLWIGTGFGVYFLLKFCKHFFIHPTYYNYAGQINDLLMTMFIVYEIKRFKKN